MKKILTTMLIFGCLVLLSFNMSVFAADYVEEELVVTSTRIENERATAPGTIEVITDEEIADSGAATVADVLRNNGMTLPSYGNVANAASVQMDGFSATQTLVLQNGVPLHTGNTGAVDLNNFSVIGIQKIEIVHGPMSVLYGTNALGGVVNIITDLTGENQTAVSILGGSNDTYRADFASKSNKFGLAVSGFKTNGEREYNAADGNNLLLQYDFFRNKQGYLILDYGHREKDSQTPGSLSWPSNSDENSKNDKLSLRGRYQGERIDYQYNLSAGQLKYEYVDQYSTSKHDTEEQLADITGTYSGDNYNLLGGVDFSRYNSESTDTGEHTLNNSAVFLQHQWLLNEKWQLVTGVRYDDTEFGSPTSPRIAVVNQLNDNFVWKVGYGKAFRAPTINELYWMYNGYPSMSNANLKSEYSERYELSASGKINRHSYDITTFYANIEDGIVNDATWIPQNIAEVKSNGIILAWRTRWNDICSTGWRYAYLDKQDKDPSAVESDLNTFGSVNLTADITLERDKWLGKLEGVHIAKRCYQGSEMPDYTLYNLTVSYRLNSDLSLRLLLNNLTDEDYQVYTDYPMPGREISLKVDYLF